LIVVMRVANNKRVMGKRTNGRFTNIVGWLATAIMFAAAIGMIVTWVI
jgi:Mn2+/Fe2+ NRAMP family transporter